MRRPLPLLLSMFLVLCAAALGWTLLATDTVADPVFPSAQELEASLSLPTALHCDPSPSTSTQCTREGQCCRCPCNATGVCDTLGGQLVCVCPCAQ